MKNTLDTKYLARNSNTKGYWTGDPAPNSFQGSQENAMPVTETELAVLRITYESVESETVEMRDA